MGGGGSSQPSATSQTVTQSNIPEWARSYAMDTFGKAQALTDINQNPWQQYQGQRFADINPLQQQYMQGASQLGPSEQGQVGSGLAGMAGLGSMMQQQFGNEQAQQYMSPYMQNVLNVQKNEAMRDYARQLPGMSAAATRAGGLGGSRGAIMQSEAMRGLQNNLQGIQAKGMQDAYTNAQGQFNQDQARRLQGFGQAIQAGQTLGGLGQQQYDQTLGALNAQRTAGSDLNAAEQQRLSAQYQDFIDQQNHPYKQLGFMSDLLRGAPSGSSVQTVYGGQSNTGATLAGLAGGLGGLALRSSGGG